MSIRGPASPLRRLALVYSAGAAAALCLGFALILCLAAGDHATNPFARGLVRLDNGRDEKMEVGSNGIVRRVTAGRKSAPPLPPAGPVTGLADALKLLRTAHARNSLGNNDAAGEDSKAVVLKVRPHDRGLYKMAIRIAGLSLRANFDADWRSVRAVLCIGVLQGPDRHACFSEYASLGLKQRISRLYDVATVLAAKDGLCDTVTSATRDFVPRGKWRPFSFPCYTLPRDAAVLWEEALRLNGSAYAGATDAKTIGRSEQRWIVKPTNGGGGDGISVVDGVDGVRSLIASADSSRPLIVQEYLRNPLLVNSHKFDLRVYVLITSISPLRLYVYDEGLVRFAALPFNDTLAKGGEKLQFLTNTSIGKKERDYFDIVWSFERLRRYLTETGRDARTLLDRVRDVILKALLASEHVFLDRFASVAPNFTCLQCYQFLGVDIIVDADEQPRLLEMNTTPDMSSRLLPSMKTTLLSEVLRIAVLNRYVDFDAAAVEAELREVGVQYVEESACKSTPTSLSPLTHRSPVLHASTDRTAVGASAGEKRTPTVCVDSADLGHIIADRNEFARLGNSGFRRVYPAAEPLRPDVAEFMEHCAGKLPAGAKGTLHYHRLRTALVDIWTRRGLADVTNPHSVPFVHPKWACTASVTTATRANATSSSAWDPPPCILGFPSVDDDRRLRASAVPN